MRWRSELGEVAAVTTRGGLLRIGIEQSEAQLEPQYPPDGFVQPRYRDRPVLHLSDEILEQRLPVVGHHVDVEPGEQRLRAVGNGATIDLAVRVPVAHHDALETHFVAQHTGQQIAVAVHLHPVDRVEARHDDFDAGVDRSGVRHGMDRLERFDIAVDVALVDALAGAAIGEEMLGGCRHVAGAEVGLGTSDALQSLDQRRAQRGDDLRVFGIAFVGSAPAVVPRDRDGGGEIPVDPCRFDLGSGRGSDPAHQIGIAGRTQADIVREDRRADDISMAVDGIGAPDRRDGRLAVGQRGGRCLPHLVCQREPAVGRRELVAVGPAIAAVEVTAEAVAPHILGGEAVDLRLDQLRDLTLDAHAREDVGYPCGLALRTILGDGWRTAGRKRCVAATRDTCRADKQGHKLFQPGPWLHFLNPMRFL